MPFILYTLQLNFYIVSMPCIVIDGKTKLIKILASHFLKMNFRITETTQSLTAADLV